MKKTTLALVLMTFLGGCAYFVSWSDLSETWIGLPIERFVAQEGVADSKWKGSDGNTIYKYHLKDLDPSCVHYWVVNPEGVIENFYYEGYCRPVG